MKISPADGRLLAVLSQPHAPTDLREIAKAANLSMAHTSSRLCRLEKVGLLLVERKPTGRRGPPARSKIEVVASAA